MRRRSLALILTGGLAIAACGGGDDSGGNTEAPTANSDSAAATVATTAAATTTAAAATTTAPPVTDGATVVVANASIAGGAAGRMTNELIAVGYTTGTPTNGINRLEESVVHYTDIDGAQEVAESLGMVLGDVEVSEMPDPVPTETGVIDGDVLLLLGNAQADRTLDEMSGADALETNGSVVVVANDSGVNGAAGDMTTTLENAGFTVGEPTNGVEPRADSVVYYTDDPDAKADAELIGEQLGGVDVEAMPDPIPTESGELDGDVLLLLGTNQAAKSLVELNP